MTHVYEKAIKEFNTQLSLNNFHAFHLEKLKKNSYDGIIIVSMGGSALASDILNMTKKEIGLQVPVVVWKNYGLPQNEYIKKPLYIFSSFSGNTEETISGFHYAYSRGAQNRTSIITTGGTLQKRAEEKEIPLITFPSQGLEPRQSAGYMYYGIITLLQACGFKIHAPEHTELRPLAYKQKGNEIARDIKNRLITIYIDAAYAPLGYIWKVKLNETAKALAFTNVVPESNHNELVGYDRKSNIPTAALLIYDKKSHLRIKKRLILMKQLLTERNIKTITIPLEGKTLLEKTWRTSMLADWTSLSLSHLYNVNPSAIPIVDSLKKKMK